MRTKPKQIATALDTWTAEDDLAAWRRLGRGGAWIDDKRPSQVKARPYAPWAPSEIHKLRRLYRRGINVKIIAARIGRSEEAVKSQLDRMGERRTRERFNANFTMSLPGGLLDGLRREAARQEITLSQLARNIMVNEMGYVPQNTNKGRP